MVLEDKINVCDIGQETDRLDDHSVENFINACGSWNEIDEAMQKPSASDDSDSDSDREDWTDIYYLKAFDTSGNELPLTSEIVAGQSIKVIAYKKAIIMFSVGLFVFVLCLYCFCFRPTSSTRTRTSKEEQNKEQQEEQNKEQQAFYFGFFSCFV